MKAGKGAHVVALSESRTDDALIRQVADQGDGHALDALVQRYDAQIQVFFSSTFADTEPATRLATMFWRRLLASIDAYDARQEPERFLESLAVNLLRDRDRTGVHGSVRTVEDLSSSRSAKQSAGYSAEFAGLDVALVDGLAARLGSSMLPSLSVDERTAFLLREEGRVWPEKVSLNWSQLAELNGVDADSAWTRFDGCRRQLFDSPARPREMPQDVGIFLVWSQSQAPRAAELDDLSMMLGVTAAVVDERWTQAVAHLAVAVSAECDAVQARVDVNADFLIALYRHYRAPGVVNRAVAGADAIALVLDAQISNGAAVCSERISDVNAACAGELKARQRIIATSFADSSESKETSAVSVKTLLSGLSEVSVRYREALLGVGIAGVVAVALVLGSGSEIKGHKDLARSLGVALYATAFEDRSSTSSLFPVPPIAVDAVGGVPEYRLGRISGELVLAVAANAPDIAIARLTYLNAAVRQLPASIDINDVGARINDLITVIQRWRKTDIAINADVGFRLQEAVDATATAAVGTGHGSYFRVGAWMSLTQHLYSAGSTDSGLLESAYRDGVGLLLEIPATMNPEIDVAIGAYRDLGAAQIPVRPQDRAKLRSVLADLHAALGNRIR